ncbi:MAG: DUF3035 domain-containing protein [Proteobacteria bacterium]|nr:DUF3035 domain-containing protein [Pseudomonadota bacterium]MBW3618269.1 DUF3035 domain-containing protein [Pseudomonadota bacterium]
MRPHSLLLLAALAAAGVSASGCSSLRQLAGAKTTPDEFRVVTKPPLVVPPEYALRPPAPGEPRPQELAPESAARNALLGARQNIVRSQGENLLVAKAGAQQADPLIRYVVDDEFGDIAHKEKSFADRILFWRKDQPSAATTAATTAAPVDAAAEQARIANLTGGRPVVIQRQGRTRFKLPGL